MLLVQLCRRNSLHSVFSNLCSSWRAFSTFTSGCKEQLVISIFIVPLCYPYSTYSRASFASTLRFLLRVLITTCMGLESRGSYAKVFSVEPFSTKQSMFNVIISFLHFINMDRIWLKLSVAFVKALYVTVMTDTWDIICGRDWSLI